MPKLINLRVGEQFTIPNLEHSFKTLAVLRSGECSVLVTGQHMKESGWANTPFRIAPSTEVKSLGTFLDVLEEEDGSRHVEGQIQEKRGRKVKNEVEFPDGEFKIKELAANLEMEYHTVMNSFNRQRDNFIEVRKEPNGGRGKLVIVWKKK